VRIRVRDAFLFLVLLVGSGFGALCAQHQGNSNATYQQLRYLLPGDDVIAVNNLELRRDAATFTFHNGSFAFYGKVNGKVTGAVFEGQGHLHITPPTAQERHNLSITTHSEEFDQDFDLAVLRFTDGTETEIHKASSGPGPADGSYGKEAQEYQSFLRHHSTEVFASEGQQYYERKIHGNLDLRLLTDVLSSSQGGFFYAAMHGHRFSRMIFQIDPLGVAGMEPEEVALENWNSNDDVMTYPLVFHRAAEYANGTTNNNEHNAAYKILNENLDVSIERNGFLSSVATVEVHAQQNGVAVIPLDLYPSLRVSSVETDKGEPLDFVQEKKDEDADFAVVLGRELKEGETATLKIAYSGKEVVTNKGGGNYYPVARENWYPNSSQGLGDYADYRMVFHVPKGLQLIATGDKVEESTDGKVTTSEWKTDAPLAVVGFSMGDFMHKEAQIGSGLEEGLTVEAYANRNIPDFVIPHLNTGAVGTLDTTPMLGTELREGEVAAQIYTDYFGRLPFSHISLTQQSACNYGQSWPMLVYLPICGFFDDTQRHQLGLHSEDMYWKVVTPHEVAHQWWGQTVGFRSYRDQWMSEGFANTSASIFLQASRPKPDDFREFWKQQRRLITEKNIFGFRPIDVGPLTMGLRLDSPKAGWDVYQNLVYPKGAYILHMIRMMMWSAKDGDDRFKATMHDFVDRYRFEAATTEDFKAVVEKHMSPQMDMDGNQRMDWFFNEYVYGTDLPSYHFESQVTQNGDASGVHLKLVESGVPASFKMVVPVYIEFADGKVIRYGSIPIAGSSTFDRTVPLPKLQSPVKRILINYYYDVLSTED